LIVQSVPLNQSWKFRVAVDPVRGGTGRRVGGTSLVSAALLTTSNRMILYVRLEEPTKNRIAWTGKDRSTLAGR